MFLTSPSNINVWEKKDTRRSRIAVPSLESSGAWSLAKGDDRDQAMEKSVHFASEI